MRDIPGVSDWRDLCAPNEYRPSSPGGRRLAIRDLYARGLKPRDISAALRVPITEVLDSIKQLERTP